MLKGVADVGGHEKCIDLVKYEEKEKLGGISERFEYTS
jgi:hypothetical protein